MLRMDLVDVAFDSEKKGYNTFGGERVRGTDIIFSVTDNNFEARNKWQFTAFIPNKWTKDNYVTIKPVVVPNRKQWATQKSRSLNFGHCTIGKYKSKCYSKMAIADKDEEQNKKYLLKGHKLPKWIENSKYF